MSIDKIMQRAQAALRHKDVSWIFSDLSDLPKSARDDPRVLRSLLSASAAGDPRLNDNPAFAAAYESLTEVERTRSLSATVSRLANDPRVQLAAGDRGVSWYLERPAAIREALKNPAIAAQLGVNLTHEIGVVAIESQQFMSEHGIVEPAPGAQPVPSNAGAAESELAKLRTKSVTGKLSKAEDARLAALYEARVARDGDAASEELASHAKALGMRERPAGEYRALIEKSVTGKLSPEEDAELTRMSGERAVEQGLVSQEDLDAEQQE